MTREQSNREKEIVRRVVKHYRGSRQAGRLHALLYTMLESDIRRIVHRVLREMRKEEK